VVQRDYGVPGGGTKGLRCAWWWYKGTLVCLVVVQRDSGVPGGGTKGLHQVDCAEVCIASPSSTKEHGAYVNSQPLCS